MRNKEWLGRQEQRHVRVCVGVLGFMIDPFISQLKIMVPSSHSYCEHVAGLYINFPVQRLAYVGHSVCRSDLCFLPLLSRFDARGLLTHV